MKTQSKKWFALILALTLGVLMFAGCSSDADETTTAAATTEAGETTTAASSEDDASNVDKGTVKLAYVNWAEGVAMTNLAKVILEEKMGLRS